MHNQTNTDENRDNDVHAEGSHEVGCAKRDRHLAIYGETGLT